MEKLTKAEERIVGASGHLLECEDSLCEDKGSPSRIGAVNQAVRILRAAIAMHAFEEAQKYAEQAIKVKDGLTT